MPVMENVATINSLIRTILALVVVGAAGTGGLVAYRTYSAGENAEENLKEAEKQLADVRDELKAKSSQLDAKLRELDEKNKTIEEQGEEIVTLNETIDEKNEVIEKQAIAMRLLKKDERKAIVSVVKQTGEGDDLITTVRWVELGDDNRPIDERVFDIPGDIVKIDAWVVKFKDEYIEEADLIRGTSICLFRRIHGEYAQKEEVHVLDEFGAPPSVYRKGEQLSDFEREIWENFWDIANDPQRAEELGIRAAHGQINYQKVEAGGKYKIELRASDGLTITRMRPDEPDPTAKPAA